MNVQTWSTWREMACVVVVPQHLKKTVSIALIVGTVFFAMTQLGVVAAGHATAMVWLKPALMYLTSLLVSNVGILSATRRTAGNVPSARSFEHGDITTLDLTRLAEAQTH
jgi:hypothetical protein